MLLTRKEAMSNGESRYFTGIPCLKGHLSWRDTVNYCCIQCRKEANRMSVSSSEKSFRRLKDGFSCSDLNNVFSYNRLTGALKWKDGLIRHESGKVVGCRIKRGSTFYRSVGIHNKRYLVHRIIFFMLNGRFPFSIDHIDGNGDNNSEKNIREVSHQDNMKNARLNISNKTGSCGVCLDKRTGKYRAYITVDGIQNHLGNFAELKEAKKARKRAEKELCFHDNHGSIKPRA